MYLGFCNKCVYIGLSDKLWVFNVLCKVSIGESHYLDSYRKGEKQEYLINLQNSKIHGFTLSKVEYQD